MKLSQKDYDQKTVLSISGDIVAENAPVLKKKFKNLKHEHFRHIIFDLHAVDFIDSSGLGILISMMRNAEENGIQFSLVRLRSEVKEIFEVTRLFRVFQIFDNVDAALKSEK